MKRNEGFADNIALLLTEDCNNLQFGLHHYLFGESPLKSPEKYASTSSDEAVQPVSISVGKTSSITDEINNIPCTEMNCANISLSYFLSLKFDRNKYSDSCAASKKNININNTLNGIYEKAEILKGFNPSHNYELLGPVRSAISMIGAREKEAVKKLEIEFFEKHSSTSSFPSHSILNKTVKSAECDDDTNTEGDHDNQFWKKDEYFYSACMTNPPFYDEDEEVVFCCLCQYL